MKFHFWLFLLGVLVLSSCGSSEKSDVFVDKIETAHLKTDFLSKEAIRFDIQIFFGGTERLNGRMTLLTNSDRGVIELNDGLKVFYNKDKVFHSPEIGKSRKARFDAYTWSYFFLLPYKLSDPGTNWTTYNNDQLKGTSWLTRQLTFDSGTGDAPDDWYIMYADKESNLLDVAAYIVTAGQPKSEAEKDPHAIEYLNYTEVDGIPIANDWVFWAWRTSEGLTKKLGSANLKNIEFVDVEDSFFDAPNDFKEI